MKTIVVKPSENDMCTSGKFKERGIMRRQGFTSEFYVESPQWLHRLPKAIEDIGVLLEPMSIVEKGIAHSFALQKRLSGGPTTVLVLGSN
jgi:glucose 1-dehydrogenase